MQILLRFTLGEHTLNETFKSQGVVGMVMSVHLNFHTLSFDRIKSIFPSKILAIEALHASTDFFKGIHFGESQTN